MRCSNCIYGGSIDEYGAVEEYAEVCGLVEENEITFNKDGCGCILTGATIQKDTTNGKTRTNRHGNLEH